MTHTRYAFIKANRHADIVRELRDVFAHVPPPGFPSAALLIRHSRAALAA